MCIELVANRFLRRVIVLLNIIDAKKKNLGQDLFLELLLSVSGFDFLQYEQN